MRRYTGKIATKLPPTRSYSGPPDPSDPKRWYEMDVETANHVIAQWQDIPMMMEHGEQPVGRVVRTWLTEGPQPDWLVEFELDEHQTMCHSLVESGVWASLSLQHNALTNKPKEVTLCREPARDGSVIISKLLADTNLAGYKPTVSETSIDSPDMSAPAAAAPAPSPSIGIRNPEPAISYINDNNKPAAVPPTEESKEAVEPENMSDFDRLQATLNNRYLTKREKESLIQVYENTISTANQLRAQVEAEQKEKEEIRSELEQQKKYGNDRTQAFVDTILQVSKLSGSEVDPDRAALARRLVQADRPMSELTNAIPEFVAASASILRHLEAQQAEQSQDFDVNRLAALKHGLQRSTLPVGHYSSGQTVSLHPGYEVKASAGFKRGRDETVDAIRSTTHGWANDPRIRPDTAAILQSFDYKGMDLRKSDISNRGSKR